jgi:hypothetical protein
MAKRIEIQNKINFDYEDGGVVFDEYLQEEFDAWVEDGNVIKMDDGYATQDAQYRNRLKDMDALKEYFYKEFIEGQYDSYAGGGKIETYSQLSKNYQLELDYKVGQTFDIDILGGTAIARIKSISFKVHEIDGKEIVDENSYRIEYLNISDNSIQESHFSFLNKLKKERNKINISVPYSIGSGIFFENSIYRDNLKLLNGLVNGFEVLYYGTRNDWFDYYVKVNEESYSVDSKDAYNSVENYIDRVSSDIKKKLTSFKKPTSKRIKVKLDYKIGQKIKIPIYGGFSDGEITRIEIYLGDNFKESYFSKVYFKNIESKNNNEFEYSYIDFEQKIKADKIPNELSVEILALKTEDIIVVRRYMDGSKLKIEKCEGYVLFLDKDNQKLKYLSGYDLEKEIFTSIEDFKSKIINTNKEFIKGQYGDYSDGGEVKVDGLTKQDFIDAFNKRVESVIENLKEKGQYDSEDFDLLGEIDKEGGFTEIEDVGYWLNWAEIKGDYDALMEIIWMANYTEYSSYQFETLAHFFFGKPMKIGLFINSGGDVEYDYNTELQKIKLLLNKIDFDKITGEIDYEEIENNTNLKFYKDGTLVMSLNGDWNEETEELDTTIDIDGETTELNYHPLDGFGNVDMEQLKKNINEAFRELNTYSAVVSIEGYEEYAEDVEGLENARATIQDIKGNTRFQVLKGSSVGIGKRVDESRVVEEFAKGGNVSSIEKKVQEVNRLIELGNKNGISVVDSRSTWEAPMKYKPIRYSNGVLYVEYQELDLYSYNRTGVSKWETKKDKILKRNMQFDNPLNDIAKMYRKALKEEGIEFAGGGEVKVVAFEDYKDFKYYVLREDEENYIVVNEEKIEHWKNSDEMERSYYYEEILPKSDVIVLGYEKNIFSKGGEAGFDDAGTSMVLYHEKQGNWVVPKGQVYLWLYDVENSRDKLQNEEFNWVFYPLTSQSMAWQSGYIPPLKKIWTKKFQKTHKGSEHLLGVIKAYLIDKENGEKELFIDMMSVNPTKKKKGIMSYMIKELRNIYKLSKEQIAFSDLTDEGKKFVDKKTYDDGGEVGNIKIGDEVYGRWNNANKWTSGIFKGETENGFEVYDFSIEKPDHIEYYAEISEDGYGGSKIYTSTKFKDRNYKNYHFSPFKDEYADGGITGDSFINVLLDYGFVETSEYMTDGRLFQKQKYFVEIDEENKRIEVSKDNDKYNYDILHQFNYGCNSPQDLIDFFNKKGIKNRKKFDDGGDVRKMSWAESFRKKIPFEMVVVAKESEKDGGNEIVFNLLVEAQNDVTAYQEARKQWNEQYESSDMSIKKVYTKKEYDNLSK